jgi:hypothetical protein
LAGINDIAENNGPSKLGGCCRQCLSPWPDLAKAHNIKVVLSSVLPAAAFPWRPAINPVEKVKALNDMLIQAYAKKNNIVYLDYFTAMADDKRGLPDNLIKGWRASLTSPATK